MHSWAMQLVAWALVGTFVTTTVLAFIVAGWKSCRNKDSRSITEPELEYIDNIIEPAHHNLPAGPSKMSYQQPEVEEHDIYDDMEMKNL